MRQTIKQQIIEHLDNGYTLTYGQANTITNSQSGYRRLQEILAENPKKYRFVKVKSENGGYYNVFGLPSCFIVSAYGFIHGYYIEYRTIEKYKKLKDDGKSPSFKTKKEAQAQIKKVVR